MLIIKNIIKNIIGKIRAKLFRKRIRRFIKLVSRTIPNKCALRSMELTEKERKRQRRKFALILNLFFYFSFWTFLVFYDMADDDQFLFLYEFHKWW